MSTYSEVLEAIDEYRVALLEEQQNEDIPSATAAFRAQGASSAFSTALRNVHATGIGVRIRGGEIIPDEFAIKVFVFEKIDLGQNTPSITGQSFQGVDIDIQHLPIQQALAQQGSVEGATTPTVNSTTPSQHQERHRPIIGGLQINPGLPFVGTLGCLVRRGSQLFALSNNHVMVNTNQLPLGTPIGQPLAFNPADQVATLSDFEPILFSSPGTFPRNRIDAAIAAIPDESLVQPGTMFGIPSYSPVAHAPMTGMRVTKSGRTTAVTTGTIIATGVNGVQVNFGTETSPIIATFDNCVEIQADSGSFSNAGDSGSVILDETTGGVVSLLFAGDGVTTTGCDIGEVMARFNVVPA